jgi:hypothetical protein
LFQAYRFEEPWDGPNNRQLADRMPKLYAFSGSHRPGLTSTNYLAVVGAETMWPGAQGRKRKEIENGSSETILIVENNGLGVHWMEPRDLVFATMDFRIDHPLGVSSWYESPAVVTTAGSVKRLSNEMSPESLRSELIAANGKRRAEGASGAAVIEDGRDRTLKNP